MTNQDKEDHALENQMKDTSPIISTPPPDKMALFEGLQQSEVKIWRSRFRILIAIFLILMVIGASGVGYFFTKHYWGKKGLQPYFRAEVVEAKKVVIKTNSGVPLAQISEHNGVVFFELFDSSGKPRASVSLGADNEVKFGLYDQDQHKIKEWGGATANAPESDPLNKSNGPSLSTSSANVPQEGKAPKYIGSKTSNKYHYPDCKWAKQITPEKVLNFHSVHEAQEQNYVRCPSCQPPLNDTPDNSLRPEVKK